MRGRSGARVLNETRVRVARFEGGFSALSPFRYRNIEKKFDNAEDEFDNLSIYLV